MLSINTGQCRPERGRRQLQTTTPAPDIAHKMQQCYTNRKTMNLCMRCAKETKDEDIFPSCCSNEDDLRDWCKKYIEFGQ